MASFPFHLRGMRSCEQEIFFFNKLSYKTTSNVLLSLETFLNLSHKVDIDGHHMVNDMFDHAIILASVNHQPPADQEGWMIVGQETVFHWSVPF
jgi:hypothetical protein